MVPYVFDGSFAGLLTLVFEYYERKPGSILPVAENDYRPSLLDPPLMIHTDPVKAGRVWRGLQRHLDASWQNRYYSAFLAEQESGFRHLFGLACYLFDEPGADCSNYGNPHVLAVARLSRQVHREKHRMEAFIRFQKLADGTFYAVIQPDFNVLPLILNHFRKRYADQPWIIYDQQRKYGLYYDLSSVSEITLEHVTAGPVKGTALLDPDEQLYTELWKNYFKSTSIATRKNTALHIRHVPKRYWRFLTEKLPD